MNKNIIFRHLYGSGESIIDPVLREVLETKGYSFAHSVRPEDQPWYFRASFYYFTNDKDVFLTDPNTSGNERIILLVRDLREVASLLALDFIDRGPNIAPLNHAMTLNEAIEFMVARHLPSVTPQTNTWPTINSALLIHFEDLEANPRDTLLRIFSHCEIDVSPELVTEILTRRAPEIEESTLSLTDPSHRFKSERLRSLCRMWFADELNQELFNRFLGYAQNRLGYAIASDDNPPGNTRHRSGFFSSGKSPYYILADDYRHSSAGIRCLHYLCHSLNELGEEAYLVAVNKTNPNLRTPLLDSEIIQKHFLTGRTPIGVYPEVTYGNPLSTPVVARWLLNRPGHLGGESNFGENETIFYFHRWCLPDVLNGSSLNIPTIDTTIFNNLDNPFEAERTGEYFYANKYHLCGEPLNLSIQHNALSLGQEKPFTPQELANTLRKAKVLFCYELSSIIPEALACGCPVLIIPSEYWAQNGDQGLFKLNGVVLASEPNALERAQSEVKDYCAFSDAEFEYCVWQIKRFIKSTQADLEAQISTPTQPSTLSLNSSLRDYWGLSREYRQDHLDGFIQRISRLPLTKHTSNGTDILTEFSQWLIERSAQLSKVLGSLSVPENEAPSSAALAPPKLLPDEENELCIRLRKLVIAEQQGEALTLMEELFQRGSSRWEIYNDLGGHYAEQGRLEEAANVLKQGAQLETESSHCLRKLAAIYTMQEDFGRILATSAMILKREPDDQEMHLFVRDVLVASSPSLDSPSWLDSNWQDLNEELQATHVREYETQNLLDEIRARAASILADHAQTSTPGSSTLATIGRKNTEYDRWVSTHALQEADTRYFQEHVSTLWKKHPLFEFVLVLRPGHEALLADTIDSLSQQFFQGWKMSIFAQSPSPDPEFESDASQIHWIQIQEEGSLAEAVNQQLVRSRANWFGFFECGTQFPHQALLVCGDYIALHPDWRLIYADDDTIGSDSLRQAPRFKPDFNPDLLRSTDYIGSFFIEKQSCIRAGGYSSFVGGEPYDMLLRILDKEGESVIGHIPDILCHVPGAVTHQANDEAAILSLQAHFQRRQVKADIHAGLIPGDTRRIHYLHPTTPKVSIIIPTRNRLDLLGPCIESLLSRTRYPDWEIIIVDNGSDDPAVPAYYKTLSTALADRIRFLDAPGEFNFAAMNNLAAREAQGEYLLLLNNDTEALHEDWLDAMMSHAQRPEIGIVGARLVTQDTQQVQHAGLVLGMNGIAGSVFNQNASSESTGMLLRAVVEQNYSAVSGACLLIRKSLYLAVEGMDDTHCVMSNGDVDLCLKIQQQGYRVLWTPYATLTHHGAAVYADASAENPHETARRLQNEAYQLTRRWLPQLANDPAWNRNLSLSSSIPICEGELAVPWNPDFHDRPRLLWMPLASPGQAEYRSLAPLRALHENALAQCSAVCQPKPGQDRAPSPIELARLAPDSLIMHAPVDDVRFISLLHYKEINADILRIYSLDDLITQIPPASHLVHKQLPSALITERLRLGLAACDRLIVSTEALAEAYRSMIDDIRILPNTIEWKVWGELSSTRRRGKKLRVGWAGAQQHAGDLQFMLDVVKATHTEVDWVFFGMMPNGAQPYVAEFHDFVHRFADYPAKLASLDLDLAVAPLEIHPFNIAKSNLRLLEYGILGWPVICTDIFPFRTDSPPVTHLPNEANRWISAIRERINDPDALAREGDALREWVKQHYLLENNLERWLKALTP